jgi:hypothetical protein
MPTYDYKCNKCGFVEEIRFRHPDDAPKDTRCVQVLPGKRPCLGRAERQISAGLAGHCRPPWADGIDYKNCGPGGPGGTQ